MTSTLPAATGTQVPAQRRPAHDTDPPVRRAAPPGRLRSSRPDLLLCGTLLVAIMLVQGWNISAYPTLSDDEGTYLAQAWAVQQGEGLAHYTYWYDHPPLGWIQIAVLTWIPALLSPESMTVGTMRGVMLLISAVSAVLVYVIARRMSLPRWAAGLAMALFGLSRCPWSSSGRSSSTTSR